MFHRARTQALPLLVLSALLAPVAPALADGMQPETSVVIVDEKLGEASMRVTNTDGVVSLLHVALQNVPEDTEQLLVVTPPLARVEPGKSQLVRFILQNRQPLLTQRLKRVTFEGIPERKPAPGSAQVGLNVRQNLPVILHPAGLAPNRTPWTGLQWSLQGSTLQMRNPTPYVVRLAEEVRLLPSNTVVKLPRAYILANETLALPIDAAARGGQGNQQVRLYPATVYGFAVDSYDAPLTGPGAH